MVGCLELGNELSGYTCLSVAERLVTSRKALLLAINAKITRSK
jgi:hypothetical protein